MLRLIIVDDEKLIRETISSIIDWKSLGIELIGVCKNGIEAYDMIIDDYPDIVLTDIKMPGLSGLELIKKVREIDNHIQFVILSGYGEFDFAKKAMKYGVKHYLLKPCNENQIIEVMEQIVEDCLLLKTNLDENIIRNIITEGLTRPDNLPTILKQYQQYIDFKSTGYKLHYVHYLTDENLQSWVDFVRDFLSQVAPGLIPHFIYVTNTLLIFFKSEYDLDQRLTDFLKNLDFKDQPVPIEHQVDSFSNLYSLLDIVLNKVGRYEYIYLIHKDRFITTYNHNSLFIKINHILNKFTSADVFEKDLFLAELKETLSEIEDENLLVTMITTILMKITSSNLVPISPSHITDFLLEINTINSCDRILADFLDKLSQHIDLQRTSQSEYKNFIEQTLQYVDDNLSNPNLSLKWIAENYLYMNVDYLSKQFIKETGYKFSYYLTSKRMEKAKQLLLQDTTKNIYDVAEQVGCGNNPQYFSQIFKKYTGMTPTTYMNRVDGH